MAHARVMRVLWAINQTPMTTSKRFARRTKDHSEQRVLDARAKAVLHALSNEPRGRALEAYLRVVGRL